MNYTAVVQQRGAWWIGWIEEVPGVNCQTRTREELLDDLRVALAESLEMNRANALAAVEGSTYEEKSGFTSPRETARAPCAPCRARLLPRLRRRAPLLVGESKHGSADRRPSPYRDRRSSRPEDL